MALKQPKHSCTYFKQNNQVHTRKTANERCIDLFRVHPFSQTSFSIAKKHNVPIFPKKLNYCLFLKQTDFPSKYAIFDTLDYS